jgi:hypothetical protein
VYVPATFVSALVPMFASIFSCICNYACILPGILHYGLVSEGMILKWKDEANCGEGL